jgi:hypothetical protein
MNRWSRAEIRRRALRAAAKAALLGVLACGDVPTQALGGPSDLPDAGPTIADAEAHEREDAAVFAHDDAAASAHDDATVLASADDAAHADAAAQEDAAVSDAGGANCDGERSSALEAGLSADEAWARYAACCDAVGWDFNQGCMAWGPPVPPALEVAV